MRPSAWPEQTEPIESVAGDRRADRRYLIQLELRWKLIRRKKVHDAGVGRTIDISSGGILFDASRELPAGLNVELSISWPVLLHDMAPLQLFVTGRIVRSKASQTAIRMTQHEFRTARVMPDLRDQSAGGRSSNQFSTAANQGFRSLR